MIIFGTGQYFKTRKVTQYGLCPACNRQAKMRSYNSMPFFHVYWVPLIPIGGRKRLHKICASCSNGTEFDPGQFDVIIEGLMERSADAIMALKNGESNFTSDPDDGPVDCVGFLHHVSDWLYSAGDYEFCDGMIAQLGDPQCRYAQAMLRAALSEIKGKNDETLSHYREASEANKDSFAPHQLLGQLLGGMKRYQESIDAYQQAINLAPAEVHYELRLAMADILVAGKMHKDASANFDWLIAKNPELAKSKEFMKYVNKSKKKAEA